MKTMKPLPVSLIVASFCFATVAFGDATPTPAPSVSTTPASATANTPASAARTLNPAQMQQQQDAFRRIQQQRNMMPAIQAGQAARLNEMRQRKAQMDALHGQPSAGNAPTRVAPDTKATPSSAVSPTATPQPSASAAKENPKN